MEKHVRIDKPIVLVGLMGAGKSSIGKRLAKYLGIPFADSDEEIERAAGCTISDLFAEHGEESFREGERRVVARLVSGSPMVLATGGGAFVNAQTRELLNAKAVTVWIDAPIEVLAERVGRNDNRPLLRDGNPVEILARLAEQRRPAYSQAHIRVVSGRGSHGEVVEAIIEAIQSRMGNQ
jgi:shikimate kinase